MSEPTEELFEVLPNLGQIPTTPILVTKDQMTIINAKLISRDAVEAAIGREYPDWNEDYFACNSCHTYIEEPEPGEAKCFCEMRNQLRAGIRRQLNLKGDALQEREVKNG